MKVDDSVPQPFSERDVRLTTTAAPPLALMHAAHLLAGLGTMLLGPILPLLSLRWHLTDSQSGMLLLAQFCGATLGGVTMSSRLARGMLIGLAAAGIGFLAFAFAPGFPLACAALLLGGFGVGRTIASINIIGGARYADNRGAALSRINVSFGLGALLSPLLAAWLTPYVALSTLLAGFAMLFVACAVALRLEMRTGPIEQLASDNASTKQPTLQPRFFLYFGAGLFLYGGLETSLSGWLTTYALRYGQSSLVLSEYTMVLLLCGLTVGRAGGSWLLLRMRDTTLQRIALLCTAGLAAALAMARQPGVIATLAVMLGVAIAPIFPATFALLMQHTPPARAAGIILAASGLGAAALPSLIGVISTRTGSLQVALAVPVAAALAMLVLSLLPPRASGEPV